MYRFRLLPPLLVAALPLVVACPDPTSVIVNNTPPEVSILIPEDGRTAVEGTDVTFRGLVSDRLTNPEELALSWSSSVDGQLLEGVSDVEGYTDFYYRDLSIGTHTITLRAVDPDGASGRDEVQVTIVEDGPPSIDIVRPTASETLYADIPVLLLASVSDEEDAADALRVSWSSGDGTALLEGVVPSSTGEATSSIDLAPGALVLVATVTDTAGNTATDTVTIGVGPANSAPTCEITAPEDGSAGVLGEEVVLRGQVGDTESPPEALSVTWSSTLEGFLGTSLPTSSGALTFPLSGLSRGTHVLSLTVEDEVGARCTDEHIFRVGLPPTLTVETPVEGAVFNVGSPVLFSGTVSDGEDLPSSIALDWSTDLAGSFATEGADSAGDISFSRADLPPGTHAMTVTATDTDGLFSRVTRGFRINGLPSAPIVGITPDPAATTDDLTAIVSAESVDPEGDPLTYDYAWFRDDSPSSASTSEVLPASATARGERWRVEVTASDAHGSGPVGSAEIVIGNLPPSLDGVTISPDPARAGDTLTCSYVGYADPDGDPDASTLAWTVNDVPSGTGSTLETTVTGGDVVTCTATPSDGASSGTPVSASLTIGNSPPTVPAVAIAPEDPTNADTLTCSVSTPATDADPADTLTYRFRWLVDAAEAGVEEATVGPERTAAGETWTCLVSAFDGMEEGPAGSASVTLAAACAARSGTSADCPGLDCLDILEAGSSTGDGVYWIQPVADAGAYEVHCDMTLDGGGWTLAAVASDDDQDTWTWNNRAYWDTDATTFGSLDTLDLDFKSLALHEVGAEDLLFEHAPSGVWAAYGGVSTGAALATLIAETGEPCTDFASGDAGYAQTAGTLATAGLLCDTRLYISERDHDGQPSSCSDIADASYGPVWNVDNGTGGCPMDDPAYSGGLGPFPMMPDDEYWVEAEAPVGFGMALGLNTGEPGTGANHMRIYVRRTLDLDGDGVPARDDCDDGDPLLGDIAEDADCDGVLVLSDCDDDDPLIGFGDASSGIGPACPGLDCLDILEAGYSTGDGRYWIDPNATGSFDVACDMTTAGGGWTGITFPLADTELGGVLVALDTAATEGIDPALGPYTQDGTDAHAYHYTFDFAPGWEQFYLGEDYRMASNAGSGGVSDIYPFCWAQSSWSEGYARSCHTSGDISFGDGDAGGPLTSLASVLGSFTRFPGGDLFSWPEGTTPYAGPVEATSFRIGWGETGSQSEGWYPWYAGTIFLRGALAPSSSEAHSAPMTR